MNTVFATIENVFEASAVLYWIGQALLFGTPLAGLTWVLLRVFRGRIHPAVESVLWTLVLIKFLVPIGPLWSCPVQAPQDIDPVLVRLVALPASYAEPIFEQTAVPAALPHSSPWHWSSMLGLAYLGCVAVLLIRQTRKHRNLLHQCRTYPEANRHIRLLTRKICRRLGVRRIPRVRVNSESSASFVIGLLQPMLVLSHRQLLRPAELETVILHEIAHLRRGDLFVRYLQWFAGTLLFFWPVIAWVNRRLDLARELACDEWALRQGKLAAAEYARCLLQALQPSRSRPMLHRATGLVTNPKSMERRIDMILNYRPRKQRAFSLLAALLVLTWGGLTLTGGLSATEGPAVQIGGWPATEEAVKTHAVEVYHLVASHERADFNHDGVLSYTEKDAYLIALAMQTPEAFLEAFPYADRNQSGRLDVLEVYGVIRGITLLSYADRRPTAMPGCLLDLEFYHMALDAQQWLINRMSHEPDPAELDNLWSVVRRVQGPCTQDHHKKLDHGGPEVVRKKVYVKRPCFNELEGNITAVKAELRTTTDPQKAAKLKTMLAKLEDLYYRLTNS